MKWIPFSFVAGLIASLIPAFKPKKGCLYNKTPEQVEDFFESLYKMMDYDPVFFREQYWDLRWSERRMFRRFYNKRWSKEFEKNYLKPLRDATGRLSDAGDKLEK
jgi:hypothetical protein